MKKIFSSLIILYLLQISLSFKCGHDSVLKDKTIKPLDMGTPNKLRNLDSSYHPIRFHIDYSSIDTNFLVDSTYIDNIKSTISKTTDHFSRLLEVKNDNPVKIGDPSQCDSAIITNWPITVDADIVIFPVIQSQYELGDSVIAAASACFIDSKTNRPIAGVLYLGSSYDFTKSNSGRFLEMVLLHEMTHILGFSTGLFQFFPHKPAFTIQRINGVDRRLIITPEVVKRAQKHFGCDRITGVELENQGGAGSAGSHWEARLMLGDYMISTDYDETVISDITLALFEDSGWYKVNYYSGGLFRYGKNQGCAFLEEKCIKNGFANFKHEFCHVPGKEKCLPGNLSKGKCYLVNYTRPLPTEYRYFTRSTAGGFIPADFCPVALPHEDKEYFLPTSCKFGRIEYNPIIPPEVFGENSICVESTLTNKDYSTQNKRYNYSAKCYQATCDKEKQEIILTIGSSTVTCPKGVATTYVEGYDGIIKCPDYSRICGGSEWCNDPIECIYKRSVTVYDEETPSPTYSSTEDLESSYPESYQLYEDWQKLQDWESSFPQIQNSVSLENSPTNATNSTNSESSKSSSNFVYLNLFFYIYFLCLC